MSNITYMYATDKWNCIISPKSETNFAYNFSGTTVEFIRSDTYIPNINYGGADKAKVFPLGGSINGTRVQDQYLFVKAKSETPVVMVLSDASLDSVAATSMSSSINDVMNLLLKVQKQVTDEVIRSEKRYTDYTYFLQSYINQAHSVGRALFTQSGHIVDILNRLRLAEDFVNKYKDSIVNMELDIENLKTSTAGLDNFINSVVKLDELTIAANNVSIKINEAIETSERLIDEITIETKTIRPEMVALENQMASITTSIAQYANDSTPEEVEATRSRLINTYAGNEEAAEVINGLATMVNSINNKVDYSEQVVLRTKKLSDIVNS